jgi:hypothetical protein
VERWRPHRSVADNRSGHQRRLSFEISFTKLRPFLTHWSSRYDDAKDKLLYDPYIGKINDPSLLKLFEWKNGGTIAQHKLQTIRENYLIHWIADADLEARYLDPAQGNGPIWNIFYLHCRSHTVYPIYDQHAYRAMIYMQDRKLCGLKDDLDKKDRPSVYKSYEHYRKFVKDIQNATGLALRPIDRALYTFGQFLKRVRPYCPE